MIFNEPARKKGFGSSRKRDVRSTIIRNWTCRSTSQASVIGPMVSRVGACGAFRPRLQRFRGLAASSHTRAPKSQSHTLTTIINQERRKSSACKKPCLPRTLAAESPHSKALIKSKAHRHTREACRGLQLSRQRKPRFSSVQLACYSGLPSFGLHQFSKLGKVNVDLHPSAVAPLNLDDPRPSPSIASTVRIALSGRTPRKY